jgi:hypothetical protein
MSYITLRGRWCYITVLNIHASSEDKTNYVKNIFYEELVRAHDIFPTYNMKVLSVDFNAKIGREDKNRNWE